MSLLTIIANATDRVGLVRPTSVVGATDPQTRQLLALANQEGVELARRHDWQGLTKEKTWTAAATQAQTGILPSDFDRFVPGTFYNRTRSRMVTGPLTPQEWQDYQSRLTSIVYDAFRVRGATLYLLPTPSGADTYAFEYVRNVWCASTGDTDPDQSAWAQDTDVAFLPETLIELGVIWRYKHARGLDYAEDFRNFELQFARITGRDGGKRTLNMGASVDKRIPRAPQAPDGNWSL